MSLNLPVVSNAADYEAHFKDEVWQKAAALICARHALPCDSLRRSPTGENIIFFVDEKFVLKIFAPFRENFLRERAALEFICGKLPVETPALLFSGELEGWSYVVMSALSGLTGRDVWAGIDRSGRMEIASQLGVMLKRLHNHAAPLSQTALNRDWRAFIERQAETSVERQRACGANPEWLERLPSYIAERLELLPTNYQLVFLHGDVHAGNLMFAHEGEDWSVTGLFDFGDSFCGFHEYDFVAPGVLMLQGDRELQRASLRAYGYQEAELNYRLRARLMLLTVLYECSDLRKYALRLNPEAVNLTLDELEAAIWRFAD
jgi:hygromycin-B 7''-O-kinase